MTTASGPQQTSAQQSSSRTPTPTSSPALRITRALVANSQVAFDLFFAPTRLQKQSAIPLSIWSTLPSRMKRNNITCWQARRLPVRHYSFVLGDALHMRGPKISAVRIGPDRRKAPRVGRHQFPRDTCLEVKEAGSIASNRRHSSGTSTGGDRCRTGPAGASPSEPLMIATSPVSSRLIAVSGGTLSGDASLSAISLGIHSVPEPR